MYIYISYHIIVHYIIVYHIILYHIIILDLVSWIDSCPMMPDNDDYTCKIRVSY